MSSTLLLRGQTELQMVVEYAESGEGREALFGRFKFWVQFQEFRNFIPPTVATSCGAGIRVMTECNVINLKELEVLAKTVYHLKCYFLKL